MDRQQPRPIFQQPDKQYMTLRDLLNCDQPRLEAPRIARPIPINTGLPSNDNKLMKNNNEPWYTNAYPSYMKSTFRTIPEQSTSSYMESGSRKRDHLGNRLPNNHLEPKPKKMRIDEAHAGSSLSTNRSEMMVNPIFIRNKGKSTTTCTVTSATATEPATAVPKIDFMITSFADKEQPLETQVTSVAAGSTPQDHHPFMEYMLE